MATGAAPIAAAAVAAWLLGGCSSSSPSTEPADTPPDTRAVATVTVELAQTRIVAWTTAQARAVVRDASGKVLTDRAVSWTTDDPLVATISSAGLLTANSLGSVSVTAEAEGVSGSIRVSVVAGPAAQIEKTAGDGQTAAPSAAVAVAPRVLVKDAWGFPVAGVPVAFTVGTGGGTVTTPVALTASDGSASCDAWTLGTTIGSQTLSASVDGGPAATFTGVALRSSGDIRVSMVWPWPDHLVGDSLDVIAQVVSTYEIAGVTATGGAAPVALAYGTYILGRGCLGGCRGWLGNLSFVGLPSGARDVVVTVTDVLGHVADAVVTVRLDRLPTLTIAAPDPEAVVSGKVSVSATCSDDAPGGCARLEVRGPWQPDPLLSGTGVVSGELDLTSREGQAIDLSFRATDTAGQSTTAVRRVYVVSNNHLSPVAAVPGTLWDLSGARVLYVDQGDAQPILRIRDTLTGTTEDVASAVGLGAQSYGFLTPAGAIYVQVDPAYTSSCELREWRDGTNATLGSANSCFSLRTAGSYAIYNNAASLFRRDLVAGSTITISDTAINWENDVAANGKVVYVRGDDYNVYAWVDGATTALTSDGPTVTNFYVRTDGVNTLYMKGSTLVLHDGTQEITLATQGPQYPWRDFALAENWIAFVRATGAGAPNQVWRRHGTTSEQLTFFGTSSTVEAVGPDGAIVLTAAGRRYLAAVGAPLVDVGSVLGRVVARDGRFFVLLAGTVLEITP